MAEVNKISSFKSFSEVKSQENEMKIREENNLKKQETLVKIEEILDEMGLSSLSEIDEDSQQLFISKLLSGERTNEGNAFVFAAGKAKAEGKKEFEFNGKKYKVTIKDTGIKEGNAFVYAAGKAKAEGKKEFEFNGKKYKVTIKDTGIKEGNAFGDAVRKAKDAGKAEFDFEGKTYKVEENIDEAISRSAYDRMDGLHDIKAMQSLIDSAKIIFDDLSEEMFDFDEICDFIVMKIKKSKLAGMYESSLTEGKHGMAKKLLQGIIAGDSTEAEGIKMSKEMAEHFLYWINTSPFGTKNQNLPIDMLIKASYSWGIERQLPTTLKKELDALKNTVKESLDVNEATIELDATDPKDKNLAKLLKKNNVSLEVINKKGPSGFPEVKLTGEVKDLKTVLADDEYGWDDADLEEYITESKEAEEAESILNDLLGERDMEELQGMSMEDALDTVETYGHSGSKAKKIAQELVSMCNESTVTEGGYRREGPSSEATHKAEQLKKLKALRLHQEETARLKKAQLKRAKAASEAIVNEAEVSSDAEFKEFAFTMLKAAFGSEFIQKKAQDIVTGILKKVGDNYGAAVGMLKGSLGESVVTEGIDVSYWEDYNTDTSGQGKKEFANKSKDFEDTFSLAVSEWNDEADGAENRIKGAQIQTIKKLAQEFFKKAGWISVNVTQAMIAQES